MSRTFQVPFQVIMEAFDRKDIHKEKLQLSSIGCLCHKKNESNLETFKKIFQEKKIRKQVRYPFILTVLRSILFLCMFAKADTKKVNTFPVQSSPDIFPPMIWTPHKLPIWVKRTGKNQHLGSSFLLPVTENRSQMQIKKRENMCDSLVF